ncbi:GNAT family N-acetyltransferase [Streptomyces sp. NPDC086023]|uniref:GNAT family N-acetyltransferase n=1 Tax=Streptomyces sp. NPDC086023 TaxID=3365746 RepID=UPI0037D97670
MAVEIKDYRDAGRLRAVENGHVVGRIVYFVLDGPVGALVPVHTVVEPGHEGRGIGGDLVRRFYEIAAEEGVPVVPLCPYAAKWASRHPELAPEPAPELVAAAEAQQAANPV